MRPVKFVFGLMLLPLCWAATGALIQAVASLAPPGLVQVSDEVWWLLAGFVLWIILYAALPRPVRTYVLAHELTHAFWAYLMGAKVSGLRVTPRGGSVRVSKTNVLITLAPYFFPFYTVCLIILYGLLSWRFDLTPYATWWLGAIGFTWAFHLTFTLSVLMERQPDIDEHGWLFSYALIYLLNIVGVAFWIVAVTPATFMPLLHAFLAGSQDAYAAVFGWLDKAWTLVAGELENFHPTAIKRADDPFFN